MQTINPDRTVPVQEDLTTEVLEFAVIRGNENMHRKDFPKAEGVSIFTGEWAVLANEELVRPGTTPDINTYPVLAGTNRYDAKATGQLTVVQNSTIVAKSERFNKSESYTSGMLLTVKDRGAGEADLTPAANEEWAFAKVTKVNDAYLVFEVFPTPMKKL